MSTDSYDSKEVCQQRLAQFIARYLVRKFDYSYRNLLKLFSRGGLSLGDIQKHLHEFWFAGPSTDALSRCQARGGPFDHIEMWGRDRTPLFLVGHPYDISKEATATLGAIRRLGMTVVVDDNGWYGFGTKHVRVYHPGTAAVFEVPSARRTNQRQASRLVRPTSRMGPNGDGIGHS
jgi:hypothetical protein